MWTASSCPAASATAASRHDPAAQYARENNVPYFGICLGMQIMVMEFARGVLGYKDANSSEFTPDGKHNVIALMADQQGNIPKAAPCVWVNTPAR